MASIKNYTPLKSSGVKRKDDQANIILLIMATVTAGVLALLLFLLIKKNF